MRISVFGLGYVGSVTAACLSHSGHHVVGVDVNEDKISAINAGKSPVLEPGIDELVMEGVTAGRLQATNDASFAINNSDIAMVCVGTPSKVNGELDLSAISTVCHDIGVAIANKGQPHTLVIRSTVLPGTIERVLIPVLSQAIGSNSEHLVAVAVNPEFMREGSAIVDFSQPPLTVAGCDDLNTAEVLRLMYEGVDSPFIHTSIRTAEMLKYAANAYHALKVCFANEIGNACQVLGADAQEVMNIFRMDTKLNISPAYLRPGFAFGGSCLPKDVRALVHAARHHDIDLPLISGIIPSNDSQIRQGIEKVLSTGKKRVGVVGLAFKPETDDLRESPMVALVEALIGKGCDVRVFDRNVNVARLTGANKDHIESTIPHITALMCDSEEEMLRHSQVLVITTSGDASARFVAAVRTGHVIVDLTQGGAGLSRLPEGAYSCDTRYQGSKSTISSVSPLLS